MSKWEKRFLKFKIWFFTIEEDHLPGIAWLVIIFFAYMIFGAIVQSHEWHTSSCEYLATYLRIGNLPGRCAYLVGGK